MKEFNIFSEYPVNKKVTAKSIKNSERIQNNLNKPRPASSATVGSSALGAVIDYSDDSPAMKRRIYDEMRRLAEG